MRERYDVVVAGAGCAGAVFSEKMASRGFRVLLLDRRSRAELGRDSCDLVETAAFELSGVEPPPAGEGCPPIRSIQVVSPDTATSIRLSSSPVTVVDRGLLARGLFAKALEAGVETRMECPVAGAEFENGRVVAVNTERGAFGCRLAVDASGDERALCRDIPAATGIPRQLRPGDRLAIYHETREANAKAEGLEPGLYEFHLGRYGGYSWVYLDEKGEVDVGTAVQDVAGKPDPREVVFGYIRSSLSVGAGVRRRGGGRVPNRRPLDSMVASGQMLIGDAACQSVPIAGRGVGGAMIGASLAAEAAGRALEAGDLSPGGLWSYNYSYMMERGARFAAIDCLRFLLQSMGEKDISWSMAKGLIGEQEVSSALVGRLDVPPVQSKLRSLLKSARGLPLLARSDSILRHARRALDLYLQYPPVYDPPEFAEWSREAEFLFDDLARL